MSSRLTGWLVAATVLLASGLVWGYWSELTARHASVTVRDVALIAAALGAAVISSWRGGIAERQQETAQAQERINNTRLIVERYQRGAELLGHRESTVQIAGVYALTYLAIGDGDDDKLAGVTDQLVFDMVFDVLRRFKVLNEQDLELAGVLKVVDECIALLNEHQNRMEQLAPTKS